jgi:site-specific DNA-methyltransferase (adenine-specific)
MHEPILLDEKGKRYQRNIKNGKEYRYYLDKGVLPNDYWIDIQAINPAAKERIGYPTQKPEALLERIIKASSNEGGLVLDPFMGGGTTIAVADRLNRQWIGIDQSAMAVKVTELRLQKQADLFTSPRRLGGG